MGNRYGPGVSSRHLPPDLFNDLCSISGSPISGNDFTYYFTNRSLQMLKFCAEDQLDDAPRPDPPRKIMWYWF